jgi:hypothetical protein
MSNQKLSENMIEETNAGVIIRVFVQPKSSKNEVIGPHNGAIKIKLTSPPVDGQANEGLIEFLAKIFKVAKRNVTLIKGETSRHKVVALRGVNLTDAKKLMKV